MRVELLRAGMAWVLWILRLKDGRSVSELARDADIGEETLREYEHGRHPDAWTTACKASYALGRHPDWVEKMTRRWITQLVYKQARANAGRKGWKLRFPWQHQTCQPAPG